MPYDYEKDGAAIYRESFATIRREADLERREGLVHVAVVAIVERRERETRETGGRLNTWR